MSDEQKLPRFNKWEVSENKASETPSTDRNKVASLLLANRGIKTSKEKKVFFNPPHPIKVGLKEFGLESKTIAKFYRRLVLALKKKEKIIVYADYDVDGVCSAAIMWEFLTNIGFNALPYIPERFSEGYGLNSQTVERIKNKYPELGLIITVDNGIVANEAVAKANSLGVDVVITDHHQKGEVLPDAYETIHSDKVCGSALAWVIVRELSKKFNKLKSFLNNWLELAAIGTVSDQMGLLGINRSIVKMGLALLKDTERLGLLELFRQAGIEKSNIGVYEINYIIAPRINAMGRMGHAIDSLRLICTNNISKAMDLAQKLEHTNKQRQDVLEKIVQKASMKVETLAMSNIIVLDDPEFHEGVIGLVAGRLVEKFYRPAIVISKNKNVSKASARSIAGFNIIEAIRKLDSLLINVGGHPMAAGFSIQTSKISLFSRKVKKVSSKELSEELLTKKLRIDTRLSFDEIRSNLLKDIDKMAPFGLENPTPTFLTEGLRVSDVRVVGAGGKHLKMKVEKDGRAFDVIGFGFGHVYQKLENGSVIDMVYNIDQNIWNGYTNTQLKIKDLRIQIDN